MSLPIHLRGRRGGVRTSQRDVPAHPFTRTARRRPDIAARCPYPSIYEDGAAASGHRSAMSLPIHLRGRRGGVRTSQRDVPAHPFTRTARRRPDIAARCPYPSIYEDGAAASGHRGAPSLPRKKEPLRRAALVKQKTNKTIGRLGLFAAERDERGQTAQTSQGQCGGFRNRSHNEVR